MIDLSFDFYCIFLGVFVGFASTILGIGGGIVVVPALLSYGNLFSVKSAIATSLVLIFLNSAINVYSFQKEKLIPWVKIKPIFVGLFIFVLFGHLIRTHVDEVMAKFLVIFIFIFLALISFVDLKNLKQRLLPEHFLIKVLIGSLSGLCSSLAGIGGAAVIVPLLSAGRWVKNEEIAPTGNVTNLIASGLSTFLVVFTSTKDIHWQAVIFILLSSIIVGHFLRSRAKPLSLQLRQKFIGLFLIAVVFILSSQLLA